MARKRLNGVWRSGTGAEVWYTGLSLEDFQVKSREQFERNMRMVDVDTNGGISAVWQPGTDGHVCMIGMSRDAFVREDRTRVDQGLRLTTLRVENGRHDAIWRAGSGRQQVLWTPSVNELHATSDRYFAEGLRIVTFEQDFEKRLFYGVWRSDLGTRRPVGQDRHAEFERVQGGGRPADGGRSPAASDLLDQWHHRDLEIRF